MKKGIFSTIAPVFLFLTAMIWGFAFAAQRAAGDSFGVLTVICLRSLLAFFVLIPVVLIADLLRRGERRLFLVQKGRFLLDITRKEWQGGILSGLLLSVASLLQQWGLVLHASAGKTAFITSLYVAIVPVLGIFVGRKTKLVVWFGVFGAVLGAFLLSFDFSGREPLGLSIGDLLVLCCALAFAAQILIIDRFSPQGDGIRISLVQFFIGTVLTLPLMFIFERNCLTGEAFSKGILPLLFLGVISSGIGYTLQILGQKGTHPAVTSVILSLESVFGLIGGALFWGERLEKPTEIAGCIVLFASVLVTELGGILGKKKGRKNS